MAMLFEQSRREWPTRQVRGILLSSDMGINSPLTLHRSSGRPLIRSVHCELAAFAKVAYLES